MRQRNICKSKRKKRLLKTESKTKEIEEYGLISFLRTVLICQHKSLVKASFFSIAEENSTAVIRAKHILFNTNKDIFFLFSFFYWWTFVSSFLLIYFWVFFLYFCFNRNLADNFILTESLHKDFG